MANNEQKFREFLRLEVNLNRKRRDDLETHVGAVNGWLKGNLTGYQRMERQGSWALGTLIKPVDDNDEYDADCQIVMNPVPNWEPSHYLYAIYNALKDNQTYAGKISLKTRCVMVNYAGDCHLDLVPRITSNGNHYVCNRATNKFEVTDGNGYRDWFNEKNRITGGNLKRVVRLLKYLRDHKNNYTAKSILLTTLAGQMIKPADEGTVAVSTVENTLVTVLGRMDAYLQGHPNMPRIINPKLPSEDFNRHWDQARYANFRNRVHSHAATVRSARNELSLERTTSLWKGLFGERFGGVPGSGGGGSSHGSGGNSSSGQRQTAGRNLVPGAGTPIVRQRNEAQGFG